MIYLDQAASSFPKPDQVIEAMIESMTSYGANPGRGAHQLAEKANQVINETRSLAAKLFGCSNPKKCLFFQNATIALNQAIQGLKWNKGDHIITSSLEHNALRRPLHYLATTYGVDVSNVEWRGSNTTFLNDVTKKINKNTKLIAMSHSSNVTGTILPIEEIMKLAKTNRIVTLIDASQTAGHASISMKDLGIDMLVFPGHKGLLGPQGIGMLLIEGNVDLQPIHFGGTGKYSEERLQPDVWPQKLEAGTLNTPGIAGLNAALKLYEQRQHEIVSRETILIDRLFNGLKKLPGITCYGPSNSEERMPIVAFNVLKVPSQEIAMILDANYNIAVRGGLHCNPLEHTSLSTLEQGVVRASVSIYNTEAEIDTCIKAMKEITNVYEKQ